MKALILVCLFASIAVADPAPVEVTAKVIEMPKTVVACGYFAIKTVVRYRVITVERGTYKPTEVLAVELCPETLSVGVQRRLKLIKPAKAGTYTDDLKNRPGTRWEVSLR